MGEYWSNLGVVQATRQGRFRHLELPNGLDTAFLWLYTFTSGITSLVALFVTDERSGGRLMVETMTRSTIVNLRVQLLLLVLAVVAVVLALVALDRTESGPDPGPSAPVTTSAPG